MSTASSSRVIVVGLCTLGVGLGLGWLLGVSSLEDSGAGSNSDTPVAGGGSAASRVLAQADPLKSQVFYPFMNLTGPTRGGTAAAKVLIGYLDSGDRALLEQARKTYIGLQEFENWGGEYSTLQWFCEYILAEDAVRATMLNNAEGRRFVELFGSDDWDPLRQYLNGKYRLARMDPGWVLYLDEIIRFNSPYRDQWERSDLVLEAMALEPGMRVADIGSGPGFYSFRFAESVGSSGRVYAVEMSEEHLDYLRLVTSMEGLDQIAVTQTEGPFPEVEEGSLDRVFLCAAYQTIYLSIREDERAAWMEAMKRALAPDGLLVVSENEPVLPPDVVPFGGISVSRPLLESQLLAYGFELVSAEHYVDQRYTLVLRKAE